MEPEPEFKTSSRGIISMILMMCVIGVVLFYIFKWDSGIQHRSTSDEIRDLKTLIEVQTTKIDSLKANETITIEKIHTEKNHYYETIKTRDDKLQEIRKYSDDDAVKFFDAYIDGVIRANDSIAQNNY